MTPEEHAQQTNERLRYDSRRDREVREKLARDGITDKTFVDWVVSMERELRNNPNWEEL